MGRPLGGRGSLAWLHSAGHTSTQPGGRGYHGDEKIRVPVESLVPTPSRAPPTCSVSSPQFCLLRMLFSTKSPTARASAAMLSRERWSLMELGGGGGGEGRGGEGRGGEGME